MKLKELLPYIDYVETLVLSKGEYGMTVLSDARNKIDEDYLNAEVGLISEYNQKIMIELEEEE